jgi:hypothetical protein
MKAANVAPQCGKICWCRRLRWIVAEDGEEAIGVGAVSRLI